MDPGVGMGRDAFADVGWFGVNRTKLLRLSRRSISARNSWCRRVAGRYRDTRSVSTDFLALYKSG